VPHTWHSQVGWPVQVSSGIDSRVQAVEATVSGLDPEVEADSIILIETV
jgi:hypothetical protein